MLVCCRNAFVLIRLWKIKHLMKYRWENFVGGFLFGFMMFRKTEDVGHIWAAGCEMRSDSFTVVTRLRYIDHWSLWSCRVEEL